MSLKSIKDELSDLKIEKKELPINEIVTSSNGIKYLDPRPLKYCKDYQMLIKPTMKRCQRCGYGLNVIKIVEEKREMFLDPESGALFETDDETPAPSSVINDVKNNRHVVSEKIPVTAYMTIATVGDEKEAMDRIVYKRFESATDCPRHVNCKP